MSIHQLHSDRGVSQAHANAAAASTDQTLVAAPGAGRHIVIDTFYVTSAGTGQVFFESSTTTQVGPRMELAAGVAHRATDVRIKCAANEALTWTSVGAGIGTHSIFVNYHIEGA